MPMLPTLRRLRQRNHKFEATSGFMIHGQKGLHNETMSQKTNEQILNFLSYPLINNKINFNLSYISQRKIAETKIFTDV